MKKKVALLTLSLLTFLLAGCCIQHDIQPATCTQPATCSKCGKTEGEPLGHEWVDATCTEPKTCSVCGITEGNPLGHKWEEATYTMPITCIVCGATVGSPKQSFFEKKGFKVYDELENISVKACIADTDTLSVLSNPDIKIVFRSYTVEPSARPNYRNIKIVFSGKGIIDPPSVDWTIIASHGTLCDYYTGHVFKSRISEDDEVVELFDSVRIAEKEYTIYYSRESEWTKLSGLPGSEGENDVEFYVTFRIDIPEGYDGLVLKIGNNEAMVTLDDVFKIEASELTEEDKNDYYFRIGK